MTYHILKVNTSSLTVLDTLTVESWNDVLATIVNYIPSTVFTLIITKGVD